MEEIKQAQKDFLTGFYTREHLISTLLKRIIYAKLHNEKFTILLVDIDRFKEINDKYGHLWGDEFLKYVASTLRLTLEDKGEIFRYGGDEFVVVFANPEPKQAYSLAKRFNVLMRNRPFLFNRRLFRLTISCGLATYPDDGEGAEELLKAADKALYFSKRYGRHTTTQASKIKAHKLRMLLWIFLEILFIGLAAFFINTYFFKGAPLETLTRLSLRRLFPLGERGDTRIILKSGDVILGRIVAQDERRLTVQGFYAQGSYTMNIERGLIQSITPIEEGLRP